MTHAVVSQLCTCQDNSTFSQINSLVTATASHPNATNSLQHLFPLLALCHSLPASFLYSSAFASVSKCFISSPPSPHCPLSHCLHSSFIIYFTTPFLHRCIPELRTRSPNVGAHHKHSPSVTNSNKQRTIECHGRISHTYLCVNRKKKRDE